MAKKYQVRIEAQRFIHNTLSNCAHDFFKRAEEKYEKEETAGVFHDMLASLLFSAFSIEAKVNFVGWKTLSDGWPERANINEKISLLNHTLDLCLEPGKRPLQTVSELMKLRNTLAHGKPDIVDETTITNIEPDVWKKLDSEWEKTVTREFVRRCREDVEELYKQLLKAAEIELEDTITTGHVSSTLILE